MYHWQPIFANKTSKLAVNLRDVKYLDNSLTEKLQRHFLKENDLVIVRSGVNAGDVCRIPKELENSVNGSYSIRFRVDEKNNPQYVSQFLNGSLAGC